MNSIVKAAATAALKAAAIYYGQKLVQPQNLKKIGIGFGAVIGASIGYAAYRILTEEEEEEE